MSALTVQFCSGMSLGSNIGNNRFDVALIIAWRGQQVFGFYYLAGGGVRKGHLAPSCQHCIIHCLSISSCLVRLRNVDPPLPPESSFPSSDGTSFPISWINLLEKYDVSVITRGCGTARRRHRACAAGWHHDGPCGLCLPTSPTSRSFSFKGNTYFVWVHCSCNHFITKCVHKM